MWTIEKGEGRRVMATCPAGHKFPAFGENCRTCPTCNIGGFYAHLRDAAERITGAPWVIERNGKTTKGISNLATGCTIGVWYMQAARHYKLSIYISTKYPSNPNFDALLERELVLKLTRWLESREDDDSKAMLTAVELYEPLFSEELKMMDAARAADVAYLASKRINPANLTAFDAWAADAAI